jgi:hypothetical protein
MKTVPVWIARALALGWLATAGAGVAMPGGHPPAWYVAGGAVVLLSFVLAPIGAGTAVVLMRRARRDGTSTPRGTVAAGWLNLVFLVVAIVLWLLFAWEATRR